MLTEALESWQAFACGCIGGPERAKTLILDACAILHAEHDDEARAETYRRDTRLEELRLAINRSHLMLGITDERDALSCVRWIMRACFCVVGAREAKR